MQVVWVDGDFSVSTEAKWDENKRGRDIVLSNNGATVTRSNGNEWGGVLGVQVFTSGQHMFAVHVEKCQTDYVYIGLAYENVDLNDNYNGRNIVLRAGVIQCIPQQNFIHSTLITIAPVHVTRAGDGSLRVFSASQGCYSGFRTGDVIRIEVTSSSARRAHAYNPSSSAHHRPHPARPCRAPRGRIPAPAACRSTWTTAP